MDKNPVASPTFRWALLLAMLAPAALGAAQEEPSPAPTTAPAASPPALLLFVGSDSNAPYSFVGEDNLPTGYDVEVLRAVADVLGQAIQIRLMPMDEAMRTVERGEAVGLVGYGQARGRPSVTDEWVLCGPTVLREYRIAILKDFNALDGEATHHDLKGLRVAVMSDDPVLALFDGNESVEIDVVRSPRQAFDQVLTRWSRAFVADANTIQYAVRTWKETDIRMVGGRFYKMDDHGPAVSRRYDPALAQGIRQAIGTLNTNGMLARLQAKWFEHQVNPQTGQHRVFLVAAILGGLAVLCLTALAWRQTLRSSVARQTRRLHAELEVVRKQLGDLQSNRVPAGGGEEETFDLEAALKESRPLTAEPTDVNALITGFADALGQRMGDSVQLTLALDPDVPPANADPERVRRILTQLCLNARDAINKHRLTHPEAPTDVWVATRRAASEEKPPNLAEAEGDFLAISVRDAGCGIRKEMVQRIFHKGYTTRPNASGYGLTYVYETIAKHGGWIDVESAPGRGATFSVFLPCA
ncbi:MAG: transporter substrate-binding domain-containing protein [Planctomycetes bacterium]|nr:transporter substrate-binding domain-containing protein [Planctomycetota bacterium]